MVKKRNADMVNKKDVETWIVKHGYPLESTVSKHFESRGFRVSLSSIYEDNITGKSREIDVTARMYSDFEKPFITEIATQIECKYSADSPFVVFYRDKIDKFTPLEFLFNEYGVYFWPTKKAENTQQILITSFETGVCGYSITQTCRKSNRDEAFEAVNSAVIASLYNCQHTEKLQKMLSNKCLFCLTIPLVVIKGDLYSCKLDGDNIQLELADFCYVRWNGSLPYNTLPLVMVIQIDYIEKFAKKFYEFSKEMLNHTENAMQKLSLVPELVKKLKLKEEVNHAH